MVEVAERWFADVQAEVEAGARSPNTARLYRHYLNRHILPGVGWFLATGVRIGEAIAVGWDTINMDHATVEIDYRTLRVKGAGLLRVRRTKSDAGHRTLPLFLDARGGWRDPSNLSRELREARGSGEFAWVTSHVFRKTCATLLENDLSARQIADQLGHANVSMTQDNYLGRRLTSRWTAQALDAAVGRALGMRGSLIRPAGVTGGMTAPVWRRRGECQGLRRFCAKS